MPRDAENTDALDSDAKRAAAYAAADNTDLAADADAMVARAKHIGEIRERIVEGLGPNNRKLRRNARCPCGSGKKFKKCCLQKMKAWITPTIKPETNDDENHD